MKADKDLYRQLRELPAAQLWSVEVPKYDQLTAKERDQQVALVRAVGVVFSTSRNPEMKAAVKAWMISLLQDPSEKIRRYATAAIPKLGGDEESERKLIDILKTTDVDREKKKVASALEKIGGAATLKAVAGSGEKLIDEQKVRASVARQGGPSNPGSRAPAWLLTPAGFAWLLGLVASAVAVGAFPIVRRLTKRLEGLQKGVERWGDGDLSTRLPVQGQDEVAFLAERFNAAAERVQTLVKSHKSLLANASHELRSPLARIRMGLELLGRDGVGAQQRSEMARSIDELDQLIDEILLASRLDLRDASDASTLGPTEEVDLVGLAAEECARTAADLEIAPGTPP